MKFHRFGFIKSQISKPTFKIPRRAAFKKYFQNSLKILDKIAQDQ